MACFFASNRSTGCPRSAATDLTTVSCDAQSVKPISDYLDSLPDDIPLFGCSAVELLYLRGYGEDIASKVHPESGLICKSHVDFLLMNWPNQHQVQQTMKKGVKIIKCALPHESPRVVNNKASIRKDEAIDWLQRTGELVHVGSPICLTHRASLQKGEGKSTVQSKSSNIPPKRDAHLKIDDTDYNNETMDFNIDDDGENESSSDLEDEPSVEPSTQTRNKISEHFEAVADLIGNKHYNSKYAWPILGDDSKRRKVSLVLSMVQLLCSFVAPGYGTELMDTVSGKLSSRKVVDSDGCSTQVLSAIGERILEAPNRRSRIETLALIVDLPFFSATKVLTTIPTVTRYLIHKARIFNRGGINFDETYTKCRYNEQAVDFFISFIARANVLVSLPWINNFVKKSDGSQVEMGVSVRLQSYVRIDQMYREELRVICKYNKGKEWYLSYGTVYKLLSAIVPRRNKRMTCVNEFWADAEEAWTRLESFVTSLGNMGYYTKTEETDLLRRVTRVLHILLEKLQSTKEESEAEEKPDQFQLDRMHGMAEKSIRYVKGFQAHVVRAVVSDNEKARVQAALENGHALITADWAQKVLPESALEPQSGYFGKTGMSVHISHVYAKIRDQFYHHSIQHVFQSSKQQSADVSAILRHVFSVLKGKGISTIVMRSDNAACYKSAELIGDLYRIANDSPSLSRYKTLFEKGPCDRTASHMKRKIREITNSKRNARDAQEVFDAITKNHPVKGTSSYLCVMGPIDKKRKKSVISDISTLFDITFEKDGILSRKHCGVGIGQRTAQSKLVQINTTLTVSESGGFIEDENFWVPLGDGTVKEKEVTDLANDQPYSGRKDFPCSTPGCYASFLRLRNLELHETIGNHKFRSSKQTLLDYAIDSLNARVETLDVAKEGRAKDSFANTAIDGDTGIVMGWALKKAPNQGISDLAHSEAASYFLTQRSMVPARRAEPREFSIMMEQMMNRDGSYKFKAWELLSEKQLIGLFSRLEKKRVSGG